jgi:hypothetical protein
VGICTSMFMVNSLLVVSTDVGGVPEVLPPHMVLLSKPDAQSISFRISLTK